MKNYDNDNNFLKMFLEFNKKYNEFNINNNIDLKFLMAELYLPKKIEIIKKDKLQYPTIIKKL